MTLYFDCFDSPIGELTVAGNDHGIAHILFAQNRHAVKGREHWQHRPAAVAEARQQLLQFLSGQRTRFTLSLAPQGTPFQLRVWQALATIPYGHTRSYRELATALGQPTATRAVGAANGRNPLPIVLPCHRVVGSNGALTGFSGGLEVKQALLQLETGHAPFALT